MHPSCARFPRVRAPAKAGAADAADLSALGEKLAMHVVAASPKYLGRADVPDDVVATQRAALAEAAAASGKPAHVVDKMVEAQSHATPRR